MNNNKSTCTYKEYERLKCLFLNGNEDKLPLCNELLKKAAFLTSSLNRYEEDIKVNGALQKSNKGNIRVNPSVKLYLQSLSVYQSIIKTLNSVLDTDISDTDDAFEEFLKKVNDE